MKTSSRWLTERNLNAIIGFLMAGTLSLVIFGTKHWYLTAMPLVLLAIGLFARGPLQSPNSSVIPTLTHKLVRLLVIAVSSLFVCGIANLVYRARY